jgi:hypothetical protein
MRKASAYAGAFLFAAEVAWDEAGDAASRVSTIIFVRLALPEI